MKYTTILDVQNYLDDKYGRHVCWAMGTTGILVNPPDEKQMERTAFPFGGRADGPLEYSILVYYPKELIVDFSDYTNIQESENLNSITIIHARDLNEKPSYANDNVLRKIKESELPVDDPFTTYWNSDDKLQRKYEFYIKDGFIYFKDLDGYQESYPELLRFWAAANCCGISVYLRDKVGEDKIKWPKSSLICECGTDNFYIGYGSYECFATCSNCQKEYSIYSG